MDPIKFTPGAHTKYFKRFLQMMPPQAQKGDSQRLMVAFFSISGLDMINSLESCNAQYRLDMIEWIYSLQIHPSDDDESWKRCGFMGSSNLKLQSADSKEYQYGHIAMTYTALSSLVILGDDLSRVNRHAVIQGVRALQQPDGSFCAHLNGSENDMRFIFCAAVICYILKDWSGMDTTLVEDFIKSSISYEGAIAQGPGLEAHGGSTYCAIAALVLMDRLCIFSEEEIEKLRRWLLMRQMAGFQGRPNKPDDTCYSFWVGATLKLLDRYQYIDGKSNRNYILSTQHILTGGFSKWCDTSPDPLHTYFGICGLSLMNEPGLKEMNCALNMSVDAVNRLTEIQKCYS
ncbi:geranylgeranyl transferase type-1 subunit beta [Neocloeon triangulifer]|uniref:geranylgeranyl transferase type-1 subunit beta n=1 Tax=Neocloeon triangulifer TaxID=2078957 RepID=UPI00286F1ECC|nr:geranylgeranyl transferase type-1 subunit beta [Neocloeon triangulifer]